MTILHLSNDFPDCVDDSKTRSIVNLIDLTRDRFDHLVYSLNRRSPSPRALGAAIVKNFAAPQLPVELIDSSEQLATVIYQAPSRGFYLRSGLDRVADWIFADISRRQIVPSIIHAHKLTMEGIVAAALSARLGVPYAITIRGSTDWKILRARPDLTRLYRRIYHEAAVAFVIAPWMLHNIDNKLGARTGSTIPLPPPTVADRIIAPSIAGPKIMSAFRLGWHKLKNAQALVSAAAILGEEIDGFELSIVGDGPPDARDELLRASAGLKVCLPGPVPHHDMQARMNASGGFALVSNSETFGLVFLEALMAGCPVVYPKGRAIDGYFDGAPFALAASPSDQGAITDAMRKLCVDEVGLKAALHKWQQAGGPERFRSDAIAKTYGDAIDSFGAGSHRPPTV